MISPTKNYPPIGAVLTRVEFVNTLVLLEQKRKKDIRSMTLDEKFWDLEQIRHLQKLVSTNKDQFPDVRTFKEARALAIAERVKRNKARSYRKVPKDWWGAKTRFQNKFSVGVDEATKPCVHEYDNDTRRTYCVASFDYEERLETLELVPVR